MIKEYEVVYGYFLIWIWFLKKCVLKPVPLVLIKLIISLHFNFCILYTFWQRLHMRNLPHKIPLLSVHCLHILIPPFFKMKIGNVSQSHCSAPDFSSGAFGVCQFSCNQGWRLRTLRNRGSKDTLILSRQVFVTGMEMIQRRHRIRNGQIYHREKLTLEGIFFFIRMH
jgi:hypothetical protein